MQEINWNEVVLEAPVDKPKGWTAIGEAELVIERWLLEKLNPSQESIDKWMDELIQNSYCFASSNYSVALTLCKAYLLAKVGASTLQILNLGSRCAQVGWTIGLAAIIELLPLERLLEAVSKEATLRDRVIMLRQIRELTPGNTGVLLTEAMEKHPDKVLELIKTTSFAPMVLAYNCGTFDHELENFFFCFNVASVHQFPQITKALWDKLVSETPEPTLHSLEFLNRYIEVHPNWRQFAEFIFHDLFAGPRQSLLDSRAVIAHLASTNGLFPDLIIRTIKEMPDGSEQDASSKFGSATRTIKDEEKAGWIAGILKRWEEIMPKDRLTKVESQGVIDKINELFFADVS